MLFLRKPNLERLPVAMCSVRMGERALQIGLDDPALTGAIAAKVGLSGHAAVAVTDDRTAAKARAAGTQAGVLVDVQITSLDALPFPDEAFDIVVIHSMGGLLAKLADATRGAVLRESARVLRPGGRVVIIETGLRGGLLGLVQRRVADSPYQARGGAAASLTLAGFKGSRVLAEREGYRFTEGLKA